MKNEDIFLLRKTYCYELPEKLIAQEPIEPRDSSKLLVYDRKLDKIKHRVFSSVIDYFNEGDVLVINTSKVIPARIYGKKEGTGANIEILLHKKINLNEWEIIAKPVKRLQVGTIILFPENLKGEITEKLDEGICKICFSYEKSFEAILDKIGSMPLPPYIKQNLNNKNRYQTIYSDIKGSSAAPTAGLHFTEELLKKIEEKGVKIAKVLLHVGLGTFRPVKEDNILNHKMHTEYFEVTKENADIINTAKINNKKVFVCGTTSVRVVESCSELINGEYKLIPKSGETDIFIYPPYKFKIVDALITNFHLPESTLMMLVSAFCGLDNVMKVYQIAVKEEYRFFSFGDACLFL